MTETGWLIEIMIMNRPQWFLAIGEKGALEFTLDSNRAIRFARKEDADRSIQNLINHCTMVFFNPPKLIATEHQWG